MDSNQGSMIAGGAGVALIVLLFLPWFSVEGADNLNAWQAFTIGDLFLLITGLVAIGAALTAGDAILPGLSWTGAAALLGAIATLLILWLLIFDWPEGTSRGIFAFVALIATAAIAFGAYTASQEDTGYTTRGDRA